MEKITAQSTPDYDMPFNPFDSAWTMQDWIIWHKALKAEYGKERGTQMLVHAWEKQSIWSMPYNWWKYNSTWVDYWKSEGYAIGSTLSKIVNAASNTAVSVAQTAQTVASDLPTLGTVLVPLSVVAIAAYAYNTFK